MASLAVTVWQERWLKNASKGPAYNQAVRVCRHLAGYTEQKGTAAFLGVTLESLRNPKWQVVFTRLKFCCRICLRKLLEALNALEELLLQRPGNEELLQARLVRSVNIVFWVSCCEATSGSEERDLKQLPLKLGGSCLLEGLMTGNLHGSEALQLLNGLLDPLRQLREAPGPGPGRVPARAELLLPRGAPLTVLLMDSQNAEDANSCAVESLCNVATSTPENEAMAAVLMAIWKSMFFNELRTRQQLGYVVSSFMRARVTHISLVFLVQTERAPEVALRSIDKFLDHAFEHVLSELTEREWLPQRAIHLSAFDQMNGRPVFLPSCLVRGSGSVGTAKV